MNTPPANQPTDFAALRSTLMRELRQVAGGFTQFTNGTSKMYFAGRYKADVEAKLVALMGLPIINQPTKAVWWSEKLKLHVRMITGRNDVCLNIPSVGGEVRGAHE